MTVPKRIWATPDDFDADCTGQFGAWTSDHADVSEDPDAAEYIRLDALADAPEVQALIAAAVKAERERCEKVADYFRDMCGQCPWPEETVIAASNICNEIAAAIRSGT